MKKLIVANLKMNLDINEIKEYQKNILKEIVVCPQYIYIPYFLNNEVGAQDCYHEETGSYTGAVSPRHLNKLGAKYVIIGHSERRKTDCDIDKKVSSALKNNLKVIFCIGEKIEENKYEKLVEQLNDLKDVSLENVIIAYEPVWAIGTGKIPTNKEIDATVNFIKETVLNSFNSEIMVLYGGSVNLNNINLLNEIDSLDGFLVGNASLKYEVINEIYKVANIRHF